ncbi:hypothetical protein EIP86_010598 [Pleurotus ostreatoroseus]|nr:hypothetical protein EIP86_010598 [Pleurotus ostreatoroseus]
MSKPCKRKRKLEETTCHSFNDADLTGRTHVAHIDRVVEKRFRQEIRRENVPFTVPPAADDTLPRPSSVPHHSFISPVADDASMVDIAAWAQTRRKARAEKRKPADGSFATLEHDAVLNAWARDKEKFLFELVRLQGLRGADPSRCARCTPVSTSTPSGNVHAPPSQIRAEYRCRDCVPGELLCRGCLLHVHTLHPFHRVEHYTGRTFEKTTLQALGLVIQLGHPPYERCPAPDVAPRSALVIHTNGHHPVNLLFCNCDKIHESGDRVQQLLRAELYPATLTDPTTYCTFRVLENFHILTLQSKISAYDYYTSLEKITDNSGLGKHHECLKSFLRVVREWRLLKLLLRAGRAHEANGVATIKPGELCVRCPACPRPGINLPRNWNTVADDLRYIYTTIIAIDANFRLKRRAVSNETRDPALGSGWAYFVEDGPYREHLRKYVDQEEISTCTGLSALMHANTKFSKGYACTGVGMCVCARHGFVLPNSVGDLQKGERYCNMDYIVASTLSILKPEGPQVLSYDIACQWTKYLCERLQEFPEHLRINLPDGEVRYVIPKYHFRAHKEAGHSQYSLNLVPGVGLSDGEEIERNWPRHDGTQASIREMGPGSRHDTLEDHFGWANWTRYVTLGSMYRRRMIKAVKENTKQSAALSEFEAGLQPQHVAKWTSQVEAFEKDSAQPDPYYIARSGLTEAEIRLQLAEQEDVEVSEGYPLLHKVTPSAMLAELLEIEDAQRRFIMKYPNTGSDTQTPNQAIEVLEKRAALRKRLAAVRDVQAIYMPCVPQLVAKYHLQRRAPNVTSSHTGTLRTAGSITRSQTAVTSADTLELTEHQPLFLPHSLALEELDACHPGLAELEERLREGQMCSSLDKVRIHLHIKSRLVTFKGRNVRHQQANTRARSKIMANEMKIISFADKYRAAWNARTSLNPVGEWTKRWRQLRREDVRCMQEDDPSNKGASESRRQVSWIWQSADSGNSEGGGGTGMVDALRVEYLRTRARARRAQEEVCLVTEEQRRILVSLEASALTWDRREGEAPQRAEHPILQQGLAAYAAKQSRIQRGLAAHFKALWAAPVTSGRGSKYSDNNDSEQDRAVDSANGNGEACINGFTIDSDDDDDSDSDSDCHDKYDDGDDGDGSESDGGRNGGLDLFDDEDLYE